MMLDAFFLPANSGHRFCLFYEPAPDEVQKGAVVYIHPFAEEMNKSRRMAALQAKRMAQAGYAVLQLDLYGCGDSSGDFGDASWSDWVADIKAACVWLRARCDVPLWLWGLRSGCLLAAEAASQLDSPVSLLFWQPVVSGKQFLQQFLRLKIAGEMLGGEGKAQMDKLRATLASGGSVEIGGYDLSSSLANGLGSAELVLSENVDRVEWFEVSGKPEATLSPLAIARLEQWKTGTRFARGSVVCGPAFWQTVEISECPTLLDASISAMAMTERLGQ